MKATTFNVNRARRDAAFQALLAKVLKPLPAAVMRSKWSEERWFSAFKNGTITRGEFDERNREMR